MEQEKIFNRLEKDFNLIQRKLFNIRPIMGATNWILIDYKVYDSNKIKVYMEDGHIQHIAIIKYNNELDDFLLVKEL